LNGISIGSTCEATDLMNNFGSTNLENDKDELFLYSVDDLNNEILIGLHEGIIDGISIYIRE
jgi:hypothetical protein